jgi:hypothetical protein
LRPADLGQLREYGLAVEEVLRQLRLFEHPPPAPRLDRPCTIGDGIRTLSEAEIRAAQPAYEAACRGGRLMEFVPASGAASRMFQALLAARDSADSLRRDDVAQRAGRGDVNAQAVLAFIDGIGRFAFRDDLRAALAADGLDLEGLASAGVFGPILDRLLGAPGLDYAALPKGLLKFHWYPGGGRTPFEEHLVEAAATVRDAGGSCRAHFTVSPEHQARFRRLLEQIRSSYELRYEMRLDVGFSTQKPSTDTIAAGLDNQPFRMPDGRLLFRPGGHGALIENLNDLRGDIVFVKNIDSVVPDRLRATALRWKKALAALLVTLQQAIFTHLARLRGEPVRAAMEDALRFAREELCLGVPGEFDAARADEQRALLIRKLDRPVRVCGVVRNTGEPGGGPFWVRGVDGSLSLQIVEQAQVDPESGEQRAIFAAATHFNPVDLVCGVRDSQGEPFDLRRFVDPQAVFIARKSKDGQELKALERPGLWNGGMADWTTIFVEVPVITFTPVKTVLDLLRPEHQPQ